MKNRLQPLVFPDAEPIANNLPQQPLSTVVPGARMFEELTGLGPGALPAPTEHNAFTVSAIYACVNLIAGAIAGLPLNLYSRSADGERDLLGDHPLWWVLNEQMTPRWSAVNGWEFLIQSLLLHGDGFARIYRNPAAQVVGLEPIHPNRVWVMVSQDGQRLVYAIGPDPWVPVEGQPVVQVLDQDDVLHLAGFGFDGRRGLSMLRHGLRMTGSVALASQEFSARFFANGARPDYALQTDQNLGADKIEQLRNQLDERHRSFEKAHRPIVLANGLKVEPISMPAEDMQLLETRQFQIEEIARIYGVPPFMIGHNEKTTSWGSGVESMSIGFVRYTLRQHLNKVQAEVNRKLFRRASPLAEFDTTELTKADTASLFTALGLAVGGAGKPGFMTQNEARARVNLKKLPGGDTLFTGTANAPAAAAEPARP